MGPPETAMEPPVGILSGGPGVIWEDALMRFSIHGRCLLALQASLASHGIAQDFGPQETIDQGQSGLMSVHACDLDGDGDADVLSLSRNDKEASWYENQGNGVFGPQQVIPITVTFSAISIAGSDMDSDGDLDVLIASSPLIAWVENTGGANFGATHSVSIDASGVGVISAADIDGDGDVDVLATLASTRPRVVWYEYVGPGNGWNGGEYNWERKVTYGVSGTGEAMAVDLDGDGDSDALFATPLNYMVAWCENLGGGNFGDPTSGANKQVISQDAQGANSVDAADLDSDGDLDVLSASHKDDKVSWYENVGKGNGTNGGSFGPQQNLSTKATGASGVLTGDLDSDGDADVLAIAPFDMAINWYENLGGGAFAPGALVYGAANGPTNIHVADLDGDGDPDVLSTTWNDLKVSWYENLMFIDCNGNGVHDPTDLLNGTSTDCDGNGRPDECDIADDPSLDCDLNGLIDFCEYTGDPALDCDGNTVLDVCEIAVDPALDWNGDGILDVCSPPNYCTANPNSSGQPAVMSASGSPLIADNNFTMTASQMPTFEFGYFLMASSQGFIPNVGGSAGNLCLGTPIYRFVKPPTGTILGSGSGGTFSFTPNLLNLPQGVMFQIGETWDFQAWFRDGFASTSNFTDGIEVMFR